ncbi:MAG: hypothetical protein LLG04_08000, partial [Parachlamydia sp.]|nr:hypothetical protein [Parachlamydia sp.]
EHCRQPLEGACVRYTKDSKRHNLHQRCDEQWQNTQPQRIEIARQAENRPFQIAAKWIKENKDEFLLACWAAALFAIVLLAPKA